MEKREKFIVFTLVFSMLGLIVYFFNVKTGLVIHTISLMLYCIDVKITPKKNGLKKVWFMSLAFWIICIIGDIAYLIQNYGVYSN